MCRFQNKIHLYNICDEFFIIEWRFTSIIECIISFMRLSLGREAFFCAKLLRPGTTSSVASLSACVYDREPPQISSCL